NGVTRFEVQPDRFPIVHRLLRRQSRHLIERTDLLGSGLIVQPVFGDGPGDAQEAPQAASASTTTFQIPWDELAQQGRIAEVMESQQLCRKTTLVGGKAGELIDV